MTNDQDRLEMPQVKILCVDDEQSVLNALKRVFLDQQYQLFTAISGEEGLLLLEKGLDAQIVISDYRMPGMHGVDFLQQVCLKWPDTVRMVLSGYADISAVVAAVNEGQIYRFISKPWNDEELIITFANAVEKYYLQLKYKQLTKELTLKNEQLERANSTLGRFIAENTSHHEFRNRVFRTSHLVLASLPIGVIGLNANHEIEVCNKIGARLLGVNEIGVIGEESRRVFPEQLSAFAEEVLKSGNASRLLTINGAEVMARGLVVKDGKESYISLLLGEED